MTKWKEEGSHRNGVSGVGGGNNCRGPGCGECKKVSLSLCFLFGEKSAEFSLGEVFAKVDGVHYNGLRERKRG